MLCHGRFAAIWGKKCLLGTEKTNNQTHDLVCPEAIPEKLQNLTKFSGSRRGSLRVLEALEKAGAELRQRFP